MSAQQPTTVARLLAQEEHALDEFDATGDSSILDRIQRNMRKLLEEGASEDAMTELQDKTKVERTAAMKDTAKRAHAAAFTEIHIGRRHTGLTETRENTLRRRADRERARQTAEGEDDVSDLEDLEAWSMSNTLPPVFSSRTAALPLEPHQREGVDFLERRAKKDNKGGILAFVMGLGKTRTALVALDRLGVTHAVALSPSVVVRGWMDEHARLGSTLPYPCNVIEASSHASERVTAWMEHGGLIALSYDILKTLASSPKYRGLSATLRTTAKVLILDEVHELKNVDNKRSALANSFSTTIRWGLTGTPLANHVRDYFNVVKLVDPTVVDDIEDNFQRDFETPIQLGVTSDATDQQRRISREKIAVLRCMFEPAVLHKSNLILRRLLPPKQEFILVYGYPEDRRVRIRDEVNPSTRYLAAQATTDRILRDIKTSLCASIIEKLEEGDKTLVFSEHPKTLRMLADAYEDIAAVLEGSTSASRRQDMISAFQEGDLEILCISTGAGAVGINCQRANRVVLLDPSENPTKDAQAVCRAWRLGQTRPVTVYRLAAADTVDMRVLRRGAVKASVAHSMVHAAHVNTQLTRADATTDAVDASEAIKLEPANRCPDGAVQRMQAKNLLGWCSFDAFFEDTINDATDLSSALNSNNIMINGRSRVVRDTNGKLHTVKPTQLVVVEAGDILPVVPPIPVYRAHADCTIIELVAEVTDRSLLGARRKELFFEVSFSPKENTWSQPARLEPFAHAVRCAPHGENTAIVCRSRVVVGKHCSEWSIASARFVPRQMDALPVEAVEKEGEKESSA